MSKQRLDEFHPRRPVVCSRRVQDPGGGAPHFAHSVTTRYRSIIIVIVAVMVARTSSRRSNRSLVVEATSL